MEDTEVIKRCQMGDKKAFQELIGKYHPLVYRFLARISENEETAEDLTQETFIKIIRNIEMFDINGSAKFSTYLIAVSKNLYIDYLRREKRMPINVSIDQYLNIEGAGNNIEDTVINRLYSQHILESMEKLTDEQRIAIKMKYVEGMTLKEIGELLNEEPKTIKSRIHNGVVKLRKMLKGRI